MTAVFQPDGRLTGEANCNEYTASYMVAQTRLTIGDVATTRRYCAEPEGAMEREASYLAALREVTSFDIRGRELTLRAADGGTVVLLFPASANSGGGSPFAPREEPPWNPPGSGPGQFNSPLGVAVDGQGNVYVADTDNNRIQKLSPAGAPLAQWGRQGSGLGQFNGPRGVAVDTPGNLYVVDSGNNRIQKLSPSGEPLAQWGRAGRGPGELDGPSAVAVDGQGNIYVADTNNDRVQKVSPSGEPLAQWGARHSDRD